MKVSVILLSTIAQVASAHYFFDTAIVSGAAQSKYVRASTRATKYNPIKFSSNPAADIRDNSLTDGPDIVCNQGAFSSAGRTEVLTVNAGDKVTLKLGVGAKMEHPGPGLVYMSKAPGNVKEYSGIDGNWFKIFQEGVCTNGDFTNDAWCTWGRDTIGATIPKDTPNGEYLVRFEHIGVHRSHVNQPEHYVSCLQVKVQSGGSGTPGPLVKFPGAYKDSDAYANFSIYNGKKDFPFPGPAVWAGGASTGSSGSSPAAPVTTTAKSAATAAPTTMATIAKPAATPASGCAALYGQCGGQGFSGSKCCSAGTCKAANQWYSQCMN